MSKAGKRRRWRLAGLAGLVAGCSLMIVLNTFYVRSSSNEACMMCHSHPDSDASWKQSVHYSNGSGVVTDCADCHLPPEGSVKHFAAQAKPGLKDVWSYLTKDKDKIDWESKSQLEYAVNIVYNETCTACHVKLFPEGITYYGVTAHLYYEENVEKLDLHCISCHLDAGHYNPGYKHTRMTGQPETGGGEIYSGAASVTAFEDFTETIPGTSASIRMVAVPGGTFKMGSPENEPFRRSDESPQREVSVSSFFMGETEVTWDQFWAFYGETMSEGRIPPEVVYFNNSREDVDAVSGPTPPFGFPDQGWGMGERPVITLTH